MQYAADRMHMRQPIPILIDHAKGSGVYDLSLVVAATLQNRTLTLRMPPDHRDYTLDFNLSQDATQALINIRDAMTFGQTNNNQILQAIERLEGRNEERHRETMAKLNTLPALLAEIKTNQDEANAEIRAKLDEQTARIAALEAALGDVDIPAEAETLIEQLKVGSKQLADLVPNAPPTP